MISFTGSLVCERYRKDVDLFKAFFVIQMCRQLKQKKHLFKLAIRLFKVDALRLEKLTPVAGIFYSESSQERPPLT